MSEEFHVWPYIKYFAVFITIRSKVTMPSELIHYVYSYIIDDTLKQYINLKYLYYEIRKQLDNNERWRRGIDNNYWRLVNGIKRNICHRHKEKNTPESFSQNIREELTFYLDKIPYPLVTCDNRLLFAAETILLPRSYTHRTYKLDGELYADMYDNMKEFGSKRKHITDKVDSVTIKVYSTSEKRAKRRDRTVFWPRIVCS